MSTDDLGAGLAAAGTCVAGFGDPATADAPSGVVFPSMLTGKSLTGRYIDPTTRRYVYDANGRAYGQETVPQLVQLALTTRRGSSVLTKLGETFATVTEINESTTRRMRAGVDDALADLTRQKLVKVLSVDVQRFNDSGLATKVRWLDLTTNQEHTTPVSQ